MTSAQPPAKEKVGLGGVSETALLTLNSRAQEARRPDAIIDDPMAVALADSIDFDFDKFGGTGSQGMALRARVFDLNMQPYLEQHPTATVVALAEGMQTSFWRLDAALPDAQFRWLTVDLEPIIEVRRRLLPASPRVTLAQSALDYGWMDAVDTSGGVLITAEGLLMYLQPEQALGLIAECAKRFPGGQMLFDVPPAWFAKITRFGALRTSRRYRVPPMPFSMTASEAADLANTVPGVRAARELSPPAGRGALFNAAASFVYRTPIFEMVRPCVTLLEFD